jgi:hypothetical protein
MDETKPAIIAETIWIINPIIVTMILIIVNMELRSFVITLNSYCNSSLIVNVIMKI